MSRAGESEFGNPKLPNSSEALEFQRVQYRPRCLVASRVWTDVCEDDEPVDRVTDSLDFGIIHLRYE
jgi:hypothetical protein